MANPLLRHDKAVVSAANTWTAISTAPSGTRAFAISKITVVNNQAFALAFHLAVGPAGGAAATIIALSVSLNPGQVYTETGLVALAGEVVSGYCATANGIVINVFGEEVDNT